MASPTLLSSTLCLLLCCSLTIAIHAEAVREPGNVVGFPASLIAAHPHLEPAPNLIKTEI